MPNQEFKLTAVAAESVKQAVLSSPRAPTQSHSEFAQSLIDAFAVVDAATIPAAGPAEAQ